MAREQKDITAYHEAGHAVMAWCCGIHVNRVSIISSDDMLGHTLYDFTVAQNAAIANNGVDFLRRLALASLSGMASDYTHWDRIAHQGSEEELKGHDSDQRKAENYLMRIGQGGRLYLDAYLGTALRHLQLEQNWRIVCELADRLLVSEVLFAHQISDLAPQVLSVGEVTWQFVEAAREAISAAGE